MDYDDIIDKRFEDVNATGTTEIQLDFGLTYLDTLAFAGQLGVAKIGASFAWTRQDTLALAAELEALDAEDQEEQDADSDDSDGDEDEDSDGEEEASEARED